MKIGVILSESIFVLKFRFLLLGKFSSRDRIDTAHSRAKKKALAKKSSHTVDVIVAINVLKQNNETANSLTE